jgi:hypothetical protein
MLLPPMKVIFMLSVNLSPCIPLSFKGEGEEFV